MLRVYFWQHERQCHQKHVQNTVLRHFSKPVADSQVLNQCIHNTMKWLCHKSSPQKKDTITMHTQVIPLQNIILVVLLWWPKLLINESNWRSHSHVGHNNKVYLNINMQGNMRHRGSSAILSLYFRQKVLLEVLDTNQPCTCIHNIHVCTQKLTWNHCKHKNKVWLNMVNRLKPISTIQS